MNFGEAFLEIKKGYIVRRRTWNREHIGDIKEHDEGGQTVKPYLFKSIDDCKFVPYVVTNEDLFAEDWEIAY